MDVLRITKTNLMGILHRRHYKTHIYSQMPILYVQLYYSRLCTIRSIPTFKPNFDFLSPFKFAGQLATIIKKGTNS